MSLCNTYFSYFPSNFASNPAEALTAGDGSNALASQAIFREVRDLDNKKSRSLIDRKDYPQLPRWLLSSTVADVYQAE